MFCCCVTVCVRMVCVLGVCVLCVCGVCVVCVADEREGAVCVCGVLSAGCDYGDDGSIISND